MLRFRADSSRVPAQPGFIARVTANTMGSTHGQANRVPTNGPVSAPLGNPRPDAGFLTTLQVIDALGKTFTNARNLDEATSTSGRLTENIRGALRQLKGATLAEPAQKALISRLSDALIAAAQMPPYSKQRWLSTPETCAFLSFTKSEAQDIDLSVLEPSVLVALARAKLAPESPMQGWLAQNAHKLSPEQALVLANLTLFNWGKVDAATIEAVKSPRHADYVYARLVGYGRIVDPNELRTDLDWMTTPPHATVAVAFAKADLSHSLANIRSGRPHVAEAFTQSALSAEVATTLVEHRHIAHKAELSEAMQAQLARGISMPEQLAALRALLKIHGAGYYTRNDSEVVMVNQKGELSASDRLNNFLTALTGFAECVENARLVETAPAVRTQWLVDAFLTVVMAIPNATNVHQLRALVAVGEVAHQLRGTYQTHLQSIVAVDSTEAAESLIARMKETAGLSSGRR